MICNGCGKEVGNNSSVCPYCGTQVNAVGDSGGFLWGLLGCCIPIVGLILFLVWKDQKPRSAKAAGIGALISVILSIIFSIIYFVFIVAVIGTAAY